MPSALASLANATVTLTLPTSGTVTDAETGNVLPVTREVTYSLYVQAGRPSIDELPGINATTTIYEGYCVNPQVLDASVVEGTTGTLSFSGQGAERCRVVSARKPFGTTGLIGSVLQASLGDRIQLQQIREN